MRFTAPQTPAKLSELIEAKGAESIEVLVAAMLSDSVSPAICTNEGCNLHLRDGAGSGRRPLRGARNNSMQSALILAVLI
jgi:hypothetical protein